MSLFEVPLRPILRGPDNERIDREVTGIGDHCPTWTPVDCPSCGSAPCSHPDVLVCEECEEDWPCFPVQAAIFELERFAGQLGNIGSPLRRRIHELRGFQRP